MQTAVQPASEQERAGGRMRGRIARNCRVRVPSVPVPQE
jgi:hypothetical protein